jgi:hypothetical protein
MGQEPIVTDPDRLQAQTRVQLGGSGMVPIWKILTLPGNWTTPYWAVLGAPQETRQVPGPCIRATARVGRCRPVSS